MPVTAVNTDTADLTMTVVGDFPAPVARLWRAFTDPRQLERFWGPPGWPATFTYFDFEVGGRARYEMTSPRGEKSRGAWEFLRIEPETGFEVLDGFVDEDGKATADMPSMRMTFEFTETAEGSRVTCVTTFPSEDALEQMLAMGAEEGSSMAFDQLAIVLSDLREYAQGKGTWTELLDDQHVRISRLIDGPRELVWRAHTEPELMRQWMLGPDGWRMTVCEIDTAPGGKYRYEWTPEEGVAGEPFGFDGESLLTERPRRMVSTEHMTGTDYPSTLNDLSLYEEDGATLVTVLIEYPDKETRDAVLATGMTDGMEASYARMERVLLG
ncbi:ATPase [Microbacterium caowuchunii]|uniref:SRPBCC family protein n=1 Tax=Microbacterium caowuchunii TaxID=2614638 RepID=UPI001246C532|nr:SRPBCC family protein [Microbacterium caowuchunii]QEV98716.1 ATPase [Microbacterium caowuchunii]